MKSRIKCLLLLAIGLVASLQSYSQYAVSTYSGNGVAAYTNGSVSNAQFNKPFGMCKDKFGNLFIADGSNTIRKITPQGIVSTYAGTTTAGYLDGPAAQAMFHSPSDLCTDDSGNVYVADFENQRIRKITTNGQVITIAGNGTAGYRDTIGSAAQFNYPRGIVIDQQNRLFVCDSWNHRIRRIDAQGMVSTYAGGGTAMGVGSTGAFVDGADTSARFFTPAGLAIDSAGNLYVADAYNHRIRKISITKQVTTLVGSGAIGNGNGGYANGLANTSKLNTPTELAVDSLGNLWISDTFNERIRWWNKATNQVYTIVGDGLPGFLNGPDSTAEFNFPRGIVLQTNQILVCDYNNHSIRAIAWMPTAIKELGQAASLINLAPNPTAANLVIHCDASLLQTQVQVQIIGINGQVMLNKAIVSPETMIDCRSWPKGLYQVRLLPSGITRSFIKD